MRTLGFLFLLLLSLASCKKASTATEPAATQTETTTAAEVGEATGITSDDINQYIASYDNLLNEYKTALQAKDATALTNLTTKFTELTAQGDKAVQEATGENQQKLIQIMKEKAAEFTAISQGTKQ
ncbi:MAG: hypothetical protein LCH44_09565 [Bacteroidetes bacterium]|jgi:hypothetical protein|nr:hypothetical protein [Bacteroidota bacterium]